MGQKVHPTSFRIGTIYEWRSQWYSDKQYAELLAEDRKIRDFINDRMSEAMISRIDIERNANQLGVKLHTAKPGIVIGRGGQNVEELRRDLETLISRPIRLRVDVSEIRVPELDAQLVARNVAEQMERRIAFRRAIKQARTAGRGQRAHHRGARRLGVEGSGPAGGVSTGVGLLLHHHHGGVVGQVPSRRRARDAGPDHNHSHQVSLPRPGPSGPVSTANKSGTPRPSGPVSAANKRGTPRPSGPVSAANKRGNPRPSPGPIPDAGSSPERYTIRRRGSAGSRATGSDQLQPGGTACATA